jgi:hypothetical protein
MTGVDITNGNRAGAAISEVTATHSAYADNGLGKLIAGSQVTGAAQHVPRHDRKGSQCANGIANKTPPALR